MSNENRYKMADARRLIVKSRPATYVAFVLILITGTIFAATGGSFLVSLGTSLIATALVSIVLITIEYVRDAEQLRAHELSKAGIISVHQSRNLEEYRNHLSSANIIDVTGYSLRSFSEQNEELLKQRSTANQLKVRILIVDPSSSAAKLMEKAENFPANHYAGALEALHNKLGELNGVEIRLIDKHLSMMIYRIDNIMYTGPYPHTGASTSALTIKLGSGWMFDRQTDDFNALWNHATPLRQIRSMR